MQCSFKALFAGVLISGISLTSLPIHAAKEPSNLPLGCKDLLKGAQSFSVFADRIARIFRELPQDDKLKDLTIDKTNLPQWLEVIEKEYLNRKPNYHDLFIITDAIRAFLKKHPEIKEKHPVKIEKFLQAIEWFKENLLRKEFKNRRGKRAVRGEFFTTVLGDYHHSKAAAVYAFENYSEQECVVLAVYLETIVEAAKKMGEPFHEYEIALAILDPKRRNRKHTLATAKATSTEPTKKSRVRGKKATDELEVAAIDGNFEELWNSMLDLQKNKGLPVTPEQMNAGGKSLVEILDRAGYPEITEMLRVGLIKAPSESQQLKWAQKLFDSFKAADEAHRYSIAASLFVLIHSLEEEFQRERRDEKLRQPSLLELETRRGILLEMLSELLTPYFKDPADLHREVTEKPLNLENLRNFVRDAFKKHSDSEDLKPQN